MAEFPSISWALSSTIHSPDRCGVRSLPFLRQPLRSLTKKISCWISPRFYRIQSPREYEFAAKSPPPGAPSTTAGRPSASQHPSAPRENSFARTEIEAASYKRPPSRDLPHRQRRAPPTSAPYSEMPTSSSPVAPTPTTPPPSKSKAGSPKTTPTSPPPSASPKKPSKTTSTKKPTARTKPTTPPNKPTNST
jgi:hypothetical protein